MKFIPKESNISDLGVSSRNIHFILGIEYAKHVELHVGLARTHPYFAEAQVLSAQKDSGC
jgi:hypothetical protein